MYLPQIIAHRGASRAEEENTLAAFRRAGEQGADGVELDVRRTADDRLVVHHDAALPDGRVIRATASDDLPDRVPTLAAALDACTGMFVNIEIKNGPDDPDFDPTEWAAHRVIAELVARTPHSRWLISSFRLETVDVCRQLLPTVPTAWLVGLATDRPALFFGEPAPDARVLVGLEGEIEAVAGDLALFADLLGVLDRGQCESGRAHGEEQLRIGVPAEGVIPPRFFSGGESEAGRKDRHEGAPRRCGGGPAAGKPRGCRAARSKR